MKRTTSGTDDSIYINDSRRFDYSGPIQTASAQSEKPGAPAPEQTPTYPSPASDPSAAHRRRLDDIYQLAMRLKANHDALCAQQTQPPEEQLDLKILAAAMEYNAVCEQYRLEEQQWTQTQSHVSNAAPGPTSDPSPDHEELSKWGPARTIEVFMRENAALLQREQDQPTVAAFAIITACDSASQINGTTLERLQAPGFAGMLNVLLQRQQAPLTAAAGHLALTMLLYYCANSLTLPKICVDAISQSLNALQTYPREDEYQLKGSTWAGLAQQPGPIQDAFAALLNRSIKRQ
ncbi:MULTISPECIES: hypothetical protein [Hydrogenophaga]|uniref:Uncharacterized protein n=1 Tax=Hydrogenophaga intermedia TaxID=65786 RepID=A0A1L1PZK0_HYDIT|nr:MULTISPECIES: hypothetical protein [Hydrogenophaga]TMU71520.1 hypothetical protein FGJ01_21700 [Hydrogenophaga intermedia]CDN90031.1 hypothetical protein BN948_04472 [Hydrogenophaga intermedia]